jgi:queuine tRNA-ribosyltransferase
VAQSRLRERLAAGGAGIVVFDVGLGAGSNALAALRAARQAGPGAAHLTVVSFERDPAALALACSDEGAERLGLSQADRAAAAALLSGGRHQEAGITWRLVEGDALAGLAAEASRADLVFWDPWSPTANPELWTWAAFSALRARCGPRATLYTYSVSTAVRSALLLAGFHVGAGEGSGPKAATTAAAVDGRDLVHPLDRRWLERLARSSAPFPADAPPDALERIRAHPQFHEGGDGAARG